MIEHAKRFVKEPLLHFLLLGAVIFVVFESVSRQAADEPDEIVVTQAKIEMLADKFARTWQRPPKDAELNGLIQDFVRDEVAVREAAAMGLDRDDTVIRRLLRQRVEFVTEEAVILAEPGDAELNAFLVEHEEAFRSDRLISFSHVFFDPQRRGGSLTADAVQLRERLNMTGGQIPVTDLAELGDATLLERQFTEIPIDDVAQIFGAGFADALSSQAPGPWSEPIASAYGQHLVQVSDIIPGAVPALADVRDAVRREWVNARRIAALDQFYAALLQRYRITIDLPQSRHQPQPPSGDDRLAVLR